MNAWTSYSGKHFVVIYNEDHGTKSGLQYNIVMSHGLFMITQRRWVFGCAEGKETNGMDFHLIEL